MAKKPTKLKPIAQGAVALTTVKLKEVDWLGHEPAMRALPTEMKKEGGKSLYRVQIGEEPDDWKPMPSIGPGANEIRLQDANGWYRIFYVAKFLDAIYILGVITKKTNQTSQLDIDNAKAKYKEAAAKNAIKKQNLAATNKATKTAAKTTKGKK